MAAVCRRAASRGVELEPPGRRVRRSARRGASRASAARWSSKGVATGLPLGRPGSPDVATEHAAREPLVTARERLRVVATEAARFCLTATRQTAVFAREFARGSTTREAEASPGVGPDE